MSFSLRYIINSFEGLVEYRCSRYLLSKFYTEPSRPLFLNLKDLLIRHLLVYKVLQNFFFRSENILENEWNKILGNPRLLSVPKPTTTFVTKSISFLAPTTIFLIRSQKL